MNIIRGIAAIPNGLDNTVVTIGNFDGVHLGHQELLKRVIKRADEINAVSVVITFEPHPAKVLRPDKAPCQLISLQEKIELFQSYGINVVICIEFTPEFAGKSPDEFAEEILCNKIGARVIIVGANYRFGKGQTGDINYLRQKGKMLGFEVEVVDPVEIGGNRVSSSRIREHLSKGEVDMAAGLLGRDYSINGVVMPGHHRGVVLGYPTANIYTVYEAIPKNGIYAVRVLRGHVVLDGACYIGNQPTFAGEKIGIEVFLFDFNGELYHEHLTVQFVKLIRDEKKFDNEEELIQQIKDDVIRAKEVLIEEAMRMKKQ
ncbi:MAG: bifunctional riboflavin kinase/FAD synthetase [Nitrospirae bacterium]|nr:bifunctional riboflavin kinase/FAD synthetase [Nitrospirota bacterium]